VYRIEFIA